MHQFKSAKIFLFLAVLLFAAKPFLGFTLYNRVHPPTVENIFVKAFTKRKQEYVEGSSYSIIAIQKKLAEPVKQLFLRFSFLLSIILPAVLFLGANVSTGFLRWLKLSLLPAGDTWLLNGKLVI